MLRQRHQPPAPTKPPKPPAGRPRRRRRPGGRTTTVVLLLFALTFLGIAVLRVLGIDGDEITVFALGLTPYVAPAGLLLALTAFALRRRIMAVAVLLLAVSMVILVLPRFFTSGQPDAKGAHLRILSASLDRGSADAAALMDTVRANQIDILDLPELSQPEVSALDRAGLADLLPYRVFAPAAGGGATGNGIASRFPLREIVLTHEPPVAEPAAVVDVPGRADIEFLAVHVRSTMDTNVDAWRGQLADLPPPVSSRIRVLAGNFSATVDHAAFRSILDRGYVDAAEQTGNGLVPTWIPTLLGGLPITIDHVLVDHRGAVVGYSVLDLPGSTHKAVFAEIALP